MIESTVERFTNRYKELDLAINLVQESADYLARIYTVSVLRKHPDRQVLRGFRLTQRIIKRLVNHQRRLEVIYWPYSIMGGK